MGHPDRKIKRQQKKDRQKEEGLDRKTVQDNQDLTPYNALKLMLNKKSVITYK